MSAKCQGVCNCPECVKQPTLHTRLKRVNEDLHYIGARYWTTLGSAMAEIDSSLVRHEFGA